MRMNWKKRLALALSVVLISGNVHVPDVVWAGGAFGTQTAMAAESADFVGEKNVSKAKTADFAGDGIGGVQTGLNDPTGGEEMPVYETTDWRAVERVPSYENRSGKRKVPDSEGVTVFSRGTGDYGYKSLSENQQKFYRQLAISLENFYASGTGFEKVTVSGKTNYVPFKVNYSNYHLKDIEAVHAMTAFQADYPWLYWLNGCVWIKSQISDVMMPLVRDDYINISFDKIKEMEQQIEAGIEVYLNQVEDEKDVYEKVRIISDQIINNVDYAFKADGKTPVDEDWAHTIVGVLDGEHHSVVCEGYAKMFAFIMNILDIPNVYVTGTAGGAHAWNCVSFDGGETYYYLDLTWDDTSGQMDYTENEWVYFAMPKSIFEKSHRADSVNSQTYDWLYALPALGDNMDYTYFERYGAHATSAEVNDMETAENFLMRARGMAPGDKCVMLLDNKSISSFISTALEWGWDEFPGTSVTDYGNETVVCADTAEKYGITAPATELALSDTSLDINNTVTREKTISLSTVTAGSDDYVRYYSDNNEVVMVNTPYTKATQGEQITFTVRQTGEAVIYAVSAAGKATASCRVTVGDGTTPTSAPTLAPTEVPDQTSAPTSIPTETPDQNSTSTPTKAPAGTSTPTKVPAGTSTPVPTKAPTGTSTSVPTKSPGQTSVPSSTKSPGQTSSPAPGIVATQKPDKNAQPTEKPDKKKSTKKNTSGKQGSLYRDTKSKAWYVITGTGKNKTVKFKKSLKKNAKTVTIPAVIIIGDKTYRVTAIADRAFAGNKKLRKIKIGKNIKTIGKKAFYGCQNLKSVKFGKNVSTIQAGAFQKCSALTMIAIPGKVKKIGSNAFRQCRRLRYILVKSDKLRANNVGRKIFAGGYPSPRVKTHKKMWKRYAGIFLSRGMSGKALFVINPVKLII